MIADGPPIRVLEVIAGGAAELILPVRAELYRILNEKLALDDPSIEVILGLLDELALETAHVPDRVDAVSGDPDDDRILASAARAGADILISGDRKHLLPLGRYQAMRISTPQAFLAAVAG